MLVCFSKFRKSENEVTETSTTSTTTTPISKSNRFCSSGEFVMFVNEREREINWMHLTWLKSVLISRSMLVKRSSPRLLESCDANLTMSSWLMYMPRGNLDLCLSTPLLVLLRERLLKPGPDVGRNAPVRLNQCSFFHSICRQMKRIFERKIQL